MTPLLAARGVSVRFGSVHAVDDVDLTVERGTALGLIGPNGAGKTTLVDAITGFVRCAGSVTLDGREIGHLPAHRRVRAGLVRTWQLVQLFDDLDVVGNITVAASAASSRGAETPEPDHVASVVDRVGLQGVADRMPSELSHGQRRLVGVARALATRPKVLCLDEPAAGLDEVESRELSSRIRALVDSGVAVLLIEHDLRVVHDVCDTICVLDRGVVIARGAPAAVLAERAVVDAYLGPGHG